jgi:hypothetical protein
MEFTHFRHNRIAGIENNMFSFGLIDHTTDSANDDRIEVMVAQTRAWVERSNSFDILGRYESRLTRQVLQFTLELERLQKDRRHQESIASMKHPNPYEKKPDTFDPASFGRTGPELVMKANAYRVLSHLPPLQPQETPKPGSTGDLVGGILPDELQPRA